MAADPEIHRPGVRKLPGRARGARCPDGANTSGRRTMSDVTPVRYVLITPARNEEAFIEKTIQSVVSQTARPARWVIVNDGSTDGTGRIIERYAALHEWIEGVHMPARRDRRFAAERHSFQAR